MRGSIGRMAALALITLVTLAASVQAAGIGDGDSTECPPESTGRFAGDPVVTDPRQIQRYMMVSGWHLEPYSEAYLDNVLTDLARHRTAGIVYGTLGAITDYLRAEQIGGDKSTLNRTIYAKARQFGTEIWLQMRLYDNQLDIGGAERNATAAEIISDPAAAAAFRDALLKDIDLYNHYFQHDCVVIMFEEAGIYHSPEGGGTFWSSSSQRIAEPNPHDDDVFGQRMSALFSTAYRDIKSVNPRCLVGMHLGHSALVDAPVLKHWFEHMEGLGTRPDFIFYDLYLKAQPDFERYSGLLQERAALITQQLGMRALHLAQLHTMNAFQHGLGVTPSRADIDAIVALDEQLSFSGIGFYSKNAVRTSHFDDDPFDPNQVGQATVYESSKDRWDYGLLKLFETSGVDFSHLFDLIVRPHNLAEQSLWLKNLKTGNWDLIGVVSGNLRRRLVNKLFVYRVLDANLYMSERNQIQVRMTGAADSIGGADLWVIASEPAKKFRSTADLLAEIDGSGHPGNSQAHGEAGAGKTVLLCIQ